MGWLSKFHLVVSVVLVISIIGDENTAINIKNFGGTPPGVCVCAVCPMDTSHLSRHMSRLSRGHSAP